MLQAIVWKVVLHKYTMIFAFSDYVEALMSETLRLVTGKLKLRSETEELTSKPPLCANFVHPDKMAAAEAHEANKRFRTRQTNE